MIGVRINGVGCFCINEYSSVSDPFSVEVSDLFWIPSYTTFALTGIQLCGEIPKLCGGYLRIYLITVFY